METLPDYPNWYNELSAEQRSKLNTIFSLYKINPNRLTRVDRGLGGIELALDKESVERLFEVEDRGSLIIDGSEIYGVAYDDFGQPEIYQIDFSGLN